MGKLSKENKQYLDPEMQMAIMKYLGEGDFSIFKVLGDSPQDILASWIYGKCLVPLGW